MEINRAQSKWRSESVLELLLFCQPRFVDTNDTSRQNIDLFPMQCHHDHLYLSPVMATGRSVSGHNDAAMSALADLLVPLSLFSLPLSNAFCLFIVALSFCLEWDMSFALKTSRRKRALMLLTQVMVSHGELAQEPIIQWLPRLLSDCFYSHIRCNSRHKFKRTLNIRCQGRFWKEKIKDYVE